MGVSSLRALLALLLSFHAAGLASDLTVVGVGMPRLAWNTNVATIRIRNSAGQDRAVRINITARSHKGIGWDTTETVPAGKTVSVRRDFIVPPFPGRARVRVTVSDGATGATVFEHTYETEFPMANNRINRLTISRPELLRSALPPPLVLSRSDFPALRRKRIGRFIFYFDPEDMGAARAIAELGGQLSREYQELGAKLGVRSGEDVAVYLFPDEATKFAYTHHRGKGLAYDHVVAEIRSADLNVLARHELVHIATDSLGSPPACFKEGLAAYLQDEGRWEGIDVDQWSRAFLDEGLFVPLGDLVALDEIGPLGTRPAVTYPESGSLMRYLDRRFGFKKLIEAYRALDGAEPSARAEILDRAFGERVDRLQEAWLASIKTVPNDLPAVRLSRVKNELAEEAAARKK